MNKVEIIPRGKTLYHGTKSKFSSGIPMGKKGTWFATNPVQAILHAAVKSSEFLDEPIYFYIYKTERPVRVLKFDSSKNMNNWAVRSGFELPKKGTFAFTNQNYKLAEHLCKAGLYDGWWFPNDQTQVMLCRPVESLRFVKVMEIKFPYGKPEGINFIKGNNRGQYVVDEAGRKYKYKLVKVKLSNLNKVPGNALYYVTPKKPTSQTLNAKYFTADGRPLPNLTREKFKSKNGFLINEKRYFSVNNSSISNENINKLRERIFEKTGTRLALSNWTIQKTNIMNEKAYRDADKIMELYKKRLEQYILNIKNYATELKRRKNLTLPANNLVRPPRPLLIDAARNYSLLPLPVARNINLNVGNLFKQTGRRNNNG
jgi:hypothetical protein